MRKKDIKQSLYRSVTQLPLPDFKSIADVPVAKMEEHDYITRQDMPVQRGVQKTLSIVCACFVMLLAIGFGWFTEFYAVNTTVMIDVNPSIEITANRREKVIKVQGLNADAQKLLQGQNYNGKSLPLAIEELLDNLIDKQYLNQEKNTVLLTVQNKDKSQNIHLQQELSSVIETALQRKFIQPNIISQALSKDKRAQLVADQYQISSGKLRYIQDILDAEKGYTLEQLAAMNMEELFHLHSKLNPTDTEISVPDNSFISSSDNDTDDADAADDTDDKDDDDGKADKDGIEDKDDTDDNDDINNAKDTSNNNIIHNSCFSEPDENDEADDNHLSEMDDDDDIDDNHLSELDDDDH